LEVSDGGVGEAERRRDYAEQPMNLRQLSRRVVAGAQRDVERLERAIEVELLDLGVGALGTLRLPMRAR
jgi:hypothetical protein